MLSDKAWLVSGTFAHINISLVPIKFMRRYQQSIIQSSYWPTALLFGMRTQLYKWLESNDKQVDGQARAAFSAAYCSIDGNKFSDLKTVRAIWIAVVTRGYTREASRYQMEYSLNSNARTRRNTNVMLAVIVPKYTLHQSQNTDAERCTYGVPRVTLFRKLSRTIIRPVCLTRHASRRLLFLDDTWQRVSCKRDKPLSDDKNNRARNSSQRLVESEWPAHDYAQWRTLYR